MNNVIARTNTKGQFVIPVQMRKNWGINPKTFLHVTDVPDVGIVIRPSLKQTKLTNEEFLRILEETKGAWAGDDWPETEAKYNAIEEKAAQELRDNSW